MANVGIIQVRGIGDCLMIVPIAKWYHDMGHEVFIALDARYTESFQDAFPYCTFVPVPPESFVPQKGILNEYWYELPFELLRQRGCETIFSFPFQECMMLDRATLPVAVRERLLQRVAQPREQEAWQTKAFKHLKLDEFKYYVAGVPIRMKWTLDIRRNKDREEALYNRLVDPSKDQLVCHLQSSEMGLDVNSIPYDATTTQLINITAEQTESIFDWLTIIERAHTLIMIDSVFSNLVDQLNLPNQKHFIRRAPRELSPIHGNHWEFVRITIPDTDSI